MKDAIIVIVVLFLIAISAACGWFFYIQYKHSRDGEIEESEYVRYNTNGYGAVTEFYTRRGDYCVGTNTGLQCDFKSMGKEK